MILESAERDDLTRQWVAMMISPRVEIAEALLRDENVPLGRLDPKWVARLAADPPITKPRVTLADFCSIPLEYDSFDTGARTR